MLFNLFQFEDGLVFLFPKKESAMCWRCWTSQGLNFVTDSIFMVGTELWRVSDLVNPSWMKWSSQLHRVRTSNSH